MLDENVVAVSASSVYRVLCEANLVCGWKPRPKVKGSGRGEPPRRPDERWQTDIKYVRVGARNDYLLSFMDVYSRYIVHHELLTWMDGQQRLRISTIIIHRGAGTTRAIPSRNCLTWANCDRRFKRTGKLRSFLASLADATLAWP